MSILWARDLLLRVQFASEMKLTGQFIRVAAISCLIGWPSFSNAQSLKTFCSSATKRIASDQDLRQASQTVFDEISYSDRDDECIYPFQVIHYSTADLLLTLGSAPGSLTHPDTTGISAYFIALQNGKSKLVNKAIDFTTTGGFGDPGKISAVNLGGDDGIVMSGGWAGGGYQSEGLAFYAFRNGHVVTLHATPELSLSANNEGSGSSSPIAIDGTWHLDSSFGSELRIDYNIKIGNRRSKTFALWRLQGERWILIAGRVPKEIKEASGG